MAVFGYDTELTTSSNTGVLNVELEVGAVKGRIRDDTVTAIV